MNTMNNQTSRDPSEHQPGDPQRDREPQDDDKDIPEKPTPVQPGQDNQRGRDRKYPRAG